MRLLPRTRGPRFVVLAAATLALVAVLWTWVFPWVDRSFVNRPAVETEQTSPASFTGPPADAEN